MKSQSFMFLFLLLIISPLFARTVLIVGDSLSAGYGIPLQKSWVSLLQAKLHQQDPAIDVVNISTSGDTTSNGLAKLPGALQAHKPVLVIIELGANDGLRGLPLADMEKNLQAMVLMSKHSGARVLLLATQLPPNYGEPFLTLFQKVYDDVAKNNRVLLLPMFLAGVAGHPELMQADDLHPNEQGQAHIFNNVWPDVLKILGSVDSVRHAD